jgi:hypothetical protein
MMKPFIGKEFGTALPRLLLIGESHYFPRASTCHMDPTIWYSSDAAKLNDTERGWIDTPGLIKDSREDGFSNRAHSIWRNSFQVLNDYGPKFAAFDEVTDHIAFYNFFQRPAYEGDSLAPTNDDFRAANDTYAQVISEVSPTAVVFLSRLAHNHISPHSQTLSQTIVVPHPGCVWWNRRAKKYGNRAGWEVLADLAKSLPWKPTSQ